MRDFLFYAFNRKVKRDESARVRRSLIIFAHQLYMRPVYSALVHAWDRRAAGKSTMYPL